MNNSFLCLIFITIFCFTFSSNANIPSVIAHRGGTGDGPENTEYVIQNSLNNGADAIWITLQLSKDNVIVLYRPKDLATLTNFRGPVSAYTSAELRSVDVAYQYLPPTYPLRKKGMTMPTLEGVLSKWPSTFFYLDIKSPDASEKIFAKTLFKTLQKNHSLGRIRVYSTEHRFIDALPSSIPHFENRDITRTILSNITMNHHCILDSKQLNNKWFGFEYMREVTVSEKFTLGESISKSFLTWDKEAINCFKRQAGNKVILFGINTKENYDNAQALGADGVLVDSPARLLN